MSRKSAAHRAVEGESPVCNAVGHSPRGHAEVRGLVHHVLQSAVVHGDLLQGQATQPANVSQPMLAGQPRSCYEVAGTVQGRKSRGSEHILKSTNLHTPVLVGAVKGQEGGTCGPRARNMGLVMGDKLRQRAMNVVQVHGTACRNFPQEMVQPPPPMPPRRTVRTIVDE